MNSSVRADIWDEVNRRVKDQLPAALIDAGVLRHKNMSIHEGCDCEYCKTRRQMTAYVSHAGRAVSAGMGHFPGDVATAVQRERVFRKLVASETLKRLLP